MNFNVPLSNKKRELSFLHFVDFYRQPIKKSALATLLLISFLLLSKENVLAQNCTQFVLVTPSPYNLDITFPDTDIVPAFADLDGDGDIDMIVSDDSPDIYFLENTSTDPRNPVFAAPVLIYDFNTSFEGHLTVADLDGDGDIDLLLGAFDGNHYYFQNTGTPTAFNFPAGSVVTNPFGLRDIGSVCSPELVDIDGDGDFDVLSGTGFGGTGGLRYFENIGTPTAPNFAPDILNPFGFGAIFGNDRYIRLDKVDIDNDGDIDFVYGNNGPFPDELGFAINEGTATAPFFVDLGSSLGLELNGNINVSPSVIDINGDGTYEAFVGNGSDEIDVYQVLGVPTLSIVEGLSVTSCVPVTLNIASNYPTSSLTISWLDAAGNVVGTGESFTTANPSNGSLIYRAVAETATGCRSNLTQFIQVSCNRQVVIDLSVTAGYNQAQLSWEVVGSRPVREYEVYVSFDGGTPNILYGTTPLTTYLADALLNGVNTSFYVVAVYNNGTRSLPSNTVTVRPSVILGEDDASVKGFAFFPNPNSGEFSIKLQEGSNSAKVSVISLSGQQVYTSTLDATQTSINLNNVASGMYIVRVETQQGTYQQKVSVVR